MKLKVLLGLFILSLAFSCKQKSEIEEKAHLIKKRTFRRRVRYFFSFSNQGFLRVIQTGDG